MFEVSGGIESEQQLDGGDEVENLYMGRPADKGGEVPRFLVEHDLATHYLALYARREVLKQFLVDFRGLGLEDEAFLFEDGGPEGSVLIFSRAEQPDLAEPTQLRTARKRVQVGFLNRDAGTGRSGESESVSSMTLGSFLNWLRIHSEVEMRAEEW